MRKLKRFLRVLVVLSCTLGALSPSSALATGTEYSTECFGADRTPNGLCHPGWELTARSYPTYFAPGGTGTIALRVFNVGAAPASGPVTLTDTLPKGLTVLEAGELGLFLNGVSPKINKDTLWDCTTAPGSEENSVVTCTLEPDALPAGVESIFAGGGGAPFGAVKASSSGLGETNLQPPVGILVKARAAAVSNLTNSVTIAGGGAPTPASTTDSITISQEIPSFGFNGFDAWLSNANGTIDTQAGSHPYEATFTMDLNNLLDGENELAPAGGAIRNIEVQLPAGFVGDPTAVPQCTREQLQFEQCPAASMIGVLTSYFAQTPYEVGGQVFNMVPPRGVPAEFGINFVQGSGLILLDAGVRSGGDYGLNTTIGQVPEKGILGTVLTLWNTPGDPSHDLWRNGVIGGCNAKEIEGTGGDSVEKGRDACTEPQNPVTKPFLTVPTSCGSVGPIIIHANTWQNEQITAEAKTELHNGNGEPVRFTGCENLQFAPAITVSPDTAKADTPTGLTVEVKPPVGGLQEQDGLSTSDIKDTTVALPKGLVINPGQAAGLHGCQEGDIPGGDDLPLPGENGEEPRFEGPSDCPQASKVGTVEIESPLIEGAAEKLFKGDVYVLQSNPPELKLLIAASADGVNLKLIGNVHLCEYTGEIVPGVASVEDRTCQAPGQLITSFEGTPQYPGTPELPFTAFRLYFSGGAQAALDTPAQCGAYGAAQGFSADFASWSSPFIPDVFPSAEFALSEGPEGTPCPSSPLPFHPELIAGSTTDQAGGFTNFSLLLQRGDGQQRISGLQFKAPAGLTGFISGVPLCDEPQAGRGECPEASKIGHAVVASGPGPYPLVIPQPGEPESPIYLTGPYEGAPFGLSIVTHVIAGPFNLGTIITRASIEIDPHTSQITVTTDPLPQEVAGVPTDLRLVNSVIEKPGFMVNPTSCAPQEFSGTAYGKPPPGAGGPEATAQISSHFKVEACGALKFEPKVSVSTSGRTSKVEGASLNYKVTYPSAPQGTQANVGYVKVELPKQLPSRLTTLQKACTQAQFKTNPAGCPAASVIGHATVHTLLLPVPLEGPAYFVSNGGEAFPNLIVVLQGDGVKIELVGDTFISKAGITSTTFHAVPDDPFSSFELTLGQGPYSALATNTNLCTQQGKLIMPNEYIAQNGAPYKQNVSIAVAGCKAALYVTKHSVKNGKVTITVSVPAAGKLTASAKGLSGTTKKAGGAGTVTVKLRLTSGEAAFLSHHHDRKLQAKINLTFKPKKGKRLSVSVIVLIK